MSACVGKNFTYTYNIFTYTCYVQEKVNFLVVLALITPKTKHTCLDDQNVDLIKEYDPNSKRASFSFTNYTNNSNILVNPDLERWRG